MKNDWLEDLIFKKFRHLCILKSQAIMLSLDIRKEIENIKPTGKDLMLSGIPITDEALQAFKLAISLYDKALGIGGK